MLPAVLLVTILIQSLLTGCQNFPTSQANTLSRVSSFAEIGRRVRIAWRSNEGSAGRDLSGSNRTFLRAGSVKADRDPGAVGGYRDRISSV